MTLLIYEEGYLWRCTAKEAHLLGHISDLLKKESPICQDIGPLWNQYIHALDECAWPGNALSSSAPKELGRKTARHIKPSFPRR